jgi:hypothetical protein
MIHDQSKLVIKVGAFDRRWVFCGKAKFSFNHDHHSTSCFKIFSRSQKVNSFPWMGAHFLGGSLASIFVGTAIALSRTNIISGTRH